MPDSAASDEPIRFVDVNDPDEGIVAFLSSRSPEGGWSGDGKPQHGDFLRVVGGNVHIATSCGYDRVWTACGGGYSYQGIKPAAGDEPGQCAKCWEAM